MTWDKAKWQIEMLAKGLHPDDLELLGLLAAGGPTLNRLPNRTSCLFAALGLVNGAVGGGLYEPATIWVSDKGKSVLLASDQNGNGTTTATQTVNPTVNSENALDDESEKT